MGVGYIDSAGDVNSPVEQREILLEESTRDFFSQEMNAVSPSLLKADSLLLFAEATFTMVVLDWDYPTYFLIDLVLLAIRSLLEMFSE